MLNKDVSKRSSSARDTAPQYNGGDVLRALEPIMKRQRDAYCLIGVTMQDLFSGNLNFVYGLASLRARTAVFSFARHDPCFSRFKLIVKGGPLKDPFDIKERLSKTERVYDTERKPKDEVALMGGAFETMFVLTLC